MAVNSICWRMPTKFTIYSAKSKRRTKLYPVLVEFRRLLESNMIAVEGVCNTDLLHAVVALYDTCLPEITPEVLYSTVCAKWAKTFILVRDLKDVLEQLQGISQEDDSSHNEKEYPVINSNVSMDDGDGGDCESNSSDQQTHTTSGQVVNITDFIITRQPTTAATTQKYANNGGDCVSSFSVNQQTHTTSGQVDITRQPTTATTEKYVNNGGDSDKEGKRYCNKCKLYSEAHHVCSSDSGVVITEGEIEQLDEIDAKDKDGEPGKFDGVFSDTDGSSESSEGEEEEEDFSKGVDAFIEAAKERRRQRLDGSVSRDSLGIESMLVGAVTYERSYSKPGEKVVQLNLLAVRRRFRRSGVGKIMLDTLKDPTVIGPYDTIAVYVDQDALDFFKKNGFTDDVVLNSRFSELTDNWINSTLMCYLPPFTGSDMSGVFRNEAEMHAMDEELKKWREKSLEAYQAQTSCVVRMQHEIKTLRLMVETQEEVIKTLTSAKERLEKEKYNLEKTRLVSQVHGTVDDVEEEDDLYEALANILGNKHISGGHDLDLRAISNGDFGDVSQEEEEILSSLISSHNEKQLIQQLKHSLLSDNTFTDVTVEIMRKVESSHIATMETSFDSRTGRLGDPGICAQLYYCGGSTGEHIENIMKRGFTKDDFTRGPYGRGLYFSIHPGQATRFAMPGKLLLANVGLGLTESVIVQDRSRVLAPPGFDSIITQGRCPSPASPGRQQQEYVVFDPLQAIPLYLIEYSTTRT